MSHSDGIIWLVNYEGQWDGMQGESPYKWTCFDRISATQLKEQLEREYPERNWYIIEKDVS